LFPSNPKCGEYSFILFCFGAYFIHRYQLQSCITSMVIKRTSCIAGRCILLHHKFLRQYGSCLNSCWEVAVALQPVKNFGSLSAFFCHFHCDKESSHCNPMISFGHFVKLLSFFGNLNVFQSSREWRNGSMRCRSTPSGFTLTWSGGLLHQKNGN
jgi:hypothetical protein